MPSAMRLAALLLLSTRLFAQGAAETQSALDRLNVLGSVLIIGAHEDDDDTASVAYFALGRHYRTAYLSIAHGCGAQNLIGDEQGNLMGVLLQQEALAARRVYGAEQLFTRAIDFGFTKTAEEALAKWPREKILSDIVWIIRRFQPDEVILCWSGTPRDGHGGHQASAILGREAYAAAADPKQFSEQLQYVRPWKAHRLMRRAAASEHGSLTLPTGSYNPLFGKSYSELATISRSFFRSQAMGYLASPQERFSVLSLVDGEPAGKDPFEGIDTSWARVEGGPAAGRILAEAALHFDPKHPGKTVPALLQVRSLLRELKGPWAQRKLTELDEAIRLCCGIWLEALTSQPTVVPGAAVYVTLSAVNRSSVPIQLTAVRLEGRGQPLDVDTAAVSLPVKSNVVHASAVADP